MLKNVDDAARLRMLKWKTSGRRVVSFCRHMGEGYFVSAFYYRPVVNFHQLYELRNGKIHAVCDSKSGISINLQDKWDNLLHNVIPAIHLHYPKFANAEDVNVSTNTTAI